MDLSFETHDPEFYLVPTDSSVAFHADIVRVTAAPRALGRVDFNVSNILIDAHEHAEFAVVDSSVDGAPVLRVRSLTSAAVLSRSSTTLGSWDVVPPDGRELHAGDEIQLVADADVQFSVRAFGRTLSRIHLKRELARAAAAKLAEFDALSSAPLTTSPFFSSPGALGPTSLVVPGDSTMLGRFVRVRAAAATERRKSAPFSSPPADMSLSGSALASASGGAQFDAGGAGAGAGARVVEMQPDDLRKHFARFVDQSGNVADDDDCVIIEPPTNSRHFPPPDKKAVLSRRVTTLLDDDDDDDEVDDDESDIVIKSRRQVDVVNAVRPNAKVCSGPDSSLIDLSSSAGLTRTPGDTSFTVERIIEHRLGDDGRYYFQVKCAGYSQADWTVTTSSLLRTAREELLKYLRGVNIPLADVQAAENRTSTGTNSSSAVVLFSASAPAAASASAPAPAPAPLITAGVLCPVCRDELTLASDVGRLACDHMCANLSLRFE